MRLKSTFSLLTLLVLLALSALAGEPPKTGVAGRVVWRDEGLKGARVFAYESWEKLHARNPLAVSEPTDGDGGFTLALPWDKNIYLVAKKLASEGDNELMKGDHFAYHGSNPVILREGEVAKLRFSTIVVGEGATFAKGDDPSTGSIEGVATYLGKPLDKAYVYVFMVEEGDFRGQSFASSPPTMADGAFRFDGLPESDYFLVARKRTTGKPSGPIRDGDWYGYYPQNPVAVKSGQTTKIEFELVKKARELDEPPQALMNTGTTLSGSITDKDGKPVAGAYAFAYQDKVMGHKKPEFMSHETGAEGRYSIIFSRPGLYYIGARSAYGDSPGIGEWYGKFDGSPDHSIKIEQGKPLTDVNIVVEKILP